MCKDGEESVPRTPSAGARKHAGLALSYVWLEIKYRPCLVVSLSSTVSSKLYSSLHVVPFLIMLEEPNAVSRP